MTAQAGGIGWWTKLAFQGPIVAEDTEDFQRRRPRQARSRATYDSILEAAVQVLARDGAAGLTTNRVAERAGVSIGTLYQYFPDKAAIVLAAAQRELARPDFLAHQKALVEALVRMVEGLLNGGAQPVSVNRRVRVANPVAPALAPRIERLVLRCLGVLTPLPVMATVRR